MEWVEHTGTTIDEAKEHALDSLGVHEDDAEFEIVSDVKTGLFGRVKEEARVRARVRPTTPRAKDERRRSRTRGRGGRGGGNNKSDGQKGERQGRDRQKEGRDRQKGSRGGARGSSSGEPNPSRKPKAKNEAAAGGNPRASAPPSGKNRDGRKDQDAKKDTDVSDDEPTMPLTQQADLAEDFVRGLADKFGTSVTFQREQVEDDEIRITVKGDDLGRMIGRRGTTAGAIDELVRTVLQRQAGSARNGRVRVDVGGVRARRAEALAKFSREQAAEVRASGRARALEPMGAADRKIVHDALTDEDGVDTVSEGEDPQRRVVIVPAGAGD